MNITAKSFSGKFGTSDDIGDIIHVHVSSPYMPITDPGENMLMFVIDISGSMEESLPMVKSSLLAFRDAILDRNPSEMEKMEPQTRDLLFRNAIKVRLIVFSNVAEEVWSSDSDQDKYFEDVVINLRTVAMTNMGDALKLAFRLTDPELFTWIVVMTDGESNEGPCRTAGSFHKLIVTSQPNNTKIITLGYGNRFDPEVLNRVGNFAYISDKEMIPVVLGNIVEEVMTATQFNCVISVDDEIQPTELTEETVIVPAGENEIIMGEVIVGDRILGTICMGEDYDYVYLVHGRNILPNLGRYKSITVQYTDINTKHFSEQTVTIEHTKCIPPDNIRELYFRAEKKRIIYNLYKIINNNSGNIDEDLKNIKNKLETWNDPIADPHKDHIVKMLDDLNIGSHVHRASTALNIATGNSYTDSTRRSKYLDTTLSATIHYMESPLINTNNTNF